MAQLLLAVNTAVAYSPMRKRGVEFKKTGAVKRRQKSVNLLSPFHGSISNLILTLRSRMGLYASAVFTANKSCAMIF